MPVSFEVWTTESILRASVVEVTSSKCMLHGVPVKGGLRDPRFGVIGKGRCTTCGKGRVGCFGHWVKGPGHHRGTRALLKDAKLPSLKSLNPKDPWDD